MKEETEANSKNISVIITAYNRTDYIQNALISIIKQSSLEHILEIIVVSNFDFSFDNIDNTIDLRKIVLDGTIGKYLAEAIESARGEILAFLDDDDEWENGKVARLYQVFSDKRVVFYHNLHSYIDQSGQYIQYVRKVEKNDLETFKKPLLFSASLDIHAIGEAIDRRADFNLSCIAARKSSIIKYIDSLRMITSGPDAFFFWVSIASMGYAFVDNLRLTRYRVYTGNVSGQKKAEYKAKELWRQIRTFELLLDIAESLDLKKEFSEMIKKWLYLYLNEYELLASVFGKESRKEILMNAISLIRCGFSKRNTLEYRALLFGIVGILDPNIAGAIYQRLSNG